MVIPLLSGFDKTFSYSNNVLPNKNKKESKLIILLTLQLLKLIEFFESFLLIYNFIKYSFIQGKKYKKWNQKLKLVNF